MKQSLTMALALATGLALGASSVALGQQKVLKISHQFPASTPQEGDFRDQLARKFADEVQKRSHGQVKVEVYPGNSLARTMSQFGALRKGALDMAVLPLAYGGGEAPEVNIGLMPTLVTSYEQGLRWKDAPIGKELARILDQMGMKIVTWVWQAGGIASKDKLVVQPEDTKGLKMRGGSREMDMMLKAAGATISSLPSNEIYMGMQTGVLDGAVASSTSLISDRLYEVGKAVTTGRNRTFWYLFEPLLISKAAYDGLTPEQQKIVMDVGASLERFAIEEAKKDDQRLADLYAKAGAKVSDMDDPTFQKWRKIAEDTAFKDFAEKVKNGKQLLDMALAVK
jgi:TRAP-type C4-dicarboxylate transport system substrate-binding protein